MYDVLVLTFLLPNSQGTINSMSSTYLSFFSNMVTINLTPLDEQENCYFGYIINSLNPYFKIYNNLVYIFLKCN